MTIVGNLQGLLRDRHKKWAHEMTELANQDAWTREIAFVVLSCDRYADLWEPCFRRLRRYWPNLPFDVFLITNQIDYTGHGVQSIKTGDDLDWSSTVRRAITQLSHPYIFLWFEDAFLDRPISDDLVNYHLKWAIKNDTAYLRLRSIPRPGEKCSENIGRLIEGVPYRNTCFASIWQRQVFLDLLKDGESAGDFEMFGTKRSDAYRNFYGVYRRPFTYLHGVVRGVWRASTLRQLTLTKDVISVSRPQMTPLDELIYLINELKGALVCCLPPGWAARLWTLKKVLLRRSR